MLSISGQAANYFVAPDGDNGNDGLAPDQAWLTIDNGDELSLLVPGDTVNLLPGTYLISAKIELVTDGTSTLPIVYQNYEDGTVILDAEDESIVMIESNGDHVVINGFELTSTGEQGINVKGDSSTVTECFVHHTGKAGIWVEGNYGLYLRNIVAFCGEDGFNNEGSGEFNKYYGNSVYSCGNMGFELKTDNSRVFNCISVLNDKGIDGSNNNICGFNDVWGNTTADYDGGVADSAGGISEDPNFVNPVQHNFNLQGNSPAIDAGLNLGYPYLGTAPDMGAVESIGFNQPPKLANIGSKSVDEGQSLAFLVTATDPNLTILALSAENLPDNASFLDNGDGSGGFEFNPDYTQAGIYNVLFIASDGDLADSELVEITVVNANQGPILDSIGSKTVDEGQNLNFTVTASDPDSMSLTLFAEDLPDNASFADHGDGSGTFDFNPDFDQAGTYDVLFIADDGELADSELVQITVVLDPISYITVIPDSTMVSADSTQQYTVLGFSSTDEPRDPGIITWSLTEALGAIDAAGLFDATTAGVGKVIAVSEYGPTDTSAYLEVRPGLVAALVIQPDRDTISADSTRQFTVSGYDSESNETSQLGDLTWEVLNDIGEIDDTGLFDAINAGSGFIRITSNLGPVELSDTVTVVPGNPAFINVTPEENLAIEDSSYQFQAYVYDSDSNYICDTTEFAGWSVTDPSGSITGDGIYTAGNDPSPPIYYIKADLGALRDSAEVTVISSGALEYIRIEWSDGTVVGDTSLTADDSVTVYCRGYDSGHNLLGNLTIDWSLVGIDSIGTLKNGYSYFTILNLSRVGSGRIAASYSGNIVDTTGIITCTPGVPDQIVISPDTATLSADSSILFTISSYDADGNPTISAIIDSWGIIGDIGTIDGSGLFDATTVDTGFIFCISGGIADTSGAIIVTPGTLAQLIVQPDSAETAFGNTLEFSALGMDSDGNDTDMGILAWEVVGDIGAVDEYGIFTALSEGTGKIAATSSIGGIADTNAIVTVLPSSLELLMITPDTASLYVDESTLFVATGFDSNYDPVYPGQLNWEVIGGIGTIDADGNFIATAAGVGKVAVSSSHYSLADTTSLIVVEVPTITEIPLGDRYIRPGQSMSPVLGFRIDNAFDKIKYLEGIRLHNASSGVGNQAQLLSNIDSISLYEDKDNSGSLNAGDDLIVKTAAVADEIELSFSQVSIGKGSGKNFFVSLKAALYSHDGDSLDFYVLTGEDFQFSDGGALAGPDSINSLGYNIVDGMVAQQTQIIASGNASINPSSDVQKVLTFDLPKNGYRPDTLKILSLFNHGTATADDIDSLILFKDNGDGEWDGHEYEIYQGILSFTGEFWSVSGLRIPLLAQNNRFYICAALAEFCSDGASIALGLPLKGIEMTSDNDGPIDYAIPSKDTITILSSETLSANIADLPSRQLIPGENNGPLVGFEFVNGFAEAVRLDSLRLRLYADDPDGASQSELDSQIDSVLVWLNRDEDFNLNSGSDSLISSGKLNNGYVMIPIGGMIIPAGGGRLELFVEALMDRELCKNGNTINFGISTVDDLYFDQTVAISGSFPLLGTEDHIITAFPAASITINTIPGANLFGGQTNRVLLDFELPGEGYDQAVLHALSIANRGTSSDGEILQAVRLWADVGRDGFSEDDLLLGNLLYNGGQWRIDGLSYPVNGLNRFLISVDIYSGTFEGGTLRFEIPVGGIEYLSGTDGPDDNPSGNPESHFLLPANRVTVISIPQPGMKVYPGAEACPILTFALYNGYLEQEHELRTVRLTNQSLSVSNPEFADYELGQISLYFDKNTNREFDDDSLIAAGYFSDGVLSLDGLNIGIPSESLSYFFIIADLPLDVIDADTLAVIVAATSDFTFGETVNLNGDLPLSRGGQVVIDGSIRAQYERVPVAQRTLSPGDRDICLFAFRPAADGDLEDVLESLEIQNSGCADTMEIERLSLWADNDGDDLWQETDIWHGNLSFYNNSWHADGLAVEVDANSGALFIVADIALSAEPNESFRAMIPLDGCQYQSGNDGPIDSVLVSDRTFIISTSGLRITYQPLNSKYTVGQDICVRVNAMNITPEAITDVVCDITPIGATGSAVSDSGYYGPLDISAGEEAEFYRCYSAQQEGELYWSLRAYSQTQPESSVVVLTDTIAIQTIPTGVKIKLISSIPTSVIRGQSHVFPLSISYAHPDTSQSSAPLRLDSLRIKITDGQGGSLLADDLFSRMVLAGGYTNLAIMESLPSESSVLLDFDIPAILYPNEKQLLSLMVDIDSSAAIGEFALEIENPGNIAFVENNSGQPVTLDPSVIFPLQTAACRIDNPSQFMAVSYIPVLGENVNYGQRDVDVIKLVLRHPGEQQSSQIQLTSLSLEFQNQAGGPVVAADLIDEVRILRQHLVIGYLNDFGMDESEINLQLGSPPVISPGEIDTIDIQISLLCSSGLPDFAMKISDSTDFIFRDLSSGLRLTAASDKDSLSAESVFPMFSGIAQLKYPAQGMEVCASASLPESIVGGTDSVELFDFLLEYPATSAYSPIVLRNLEVSVLDTLDRALDPSELFDRIGVSLGSGQLTYQPFVQLRDGRAIFEINDEGLIINPGESIDLKLVADFENDAPYDYFLLLIQTADNIEAVDATDTSYSPELSVSIECSQEFPFNSGITKIFLPSGRPMFALPDQPPRIGYPGQSGATLFMGELNYNSSNATGDLLFSSLQGGILKRDQNGLVQISGESVFDAVYLYLDDQLVASDTLLAGGEFMLEAGAEYVLSRGDIYAVRLICDISQLAENGNYAVSFEDSTFLCLSDRNLGNVIYPVALSQIYPLRGPEISLSASSLEGSFTNYPNPFNPQTDIFTRIGFVLDENAYIDIELFSITGENVKVVVSNSYRSAGPYTSDTWSGMNADGLEVVPGTYFCRITARYDSGREESFRRKIAVLR